LRNPLSNHKVALFASIGALGVIAFVVIAVVGVGTRATAATSPSHVSQQQPCEGLEVVESATLLCTHGGDPAQAFQIDPEPGSGSIERAVAQAPPAPCRDGGVSGKRVEAIYAVPQDRTNNFGAALPTVRAAVDDADSFLDQSTPGVLGQHYRWLCENGSDVTIRNVTLIPVGGDGQFTSSDMVFSLQNQVAGGLGPSDFVSSDRAYLVFVDQISDVYPHGGEGNIFNDDSPGSTTNLHQVGPHYSLVNGFSGFVAEHELGHNIGAVQLSAPHSSGAFHCFEENDVMCYPDGGSYFTAGGTLVFNCPGLPVTQFDCGQDDYYSLQPAAGTYLASHWNTSNSVFLTAPTVLDHFKCYALREGDDDDDDDRRVTLEDQFGSGGARVGAAVELCNPVSKGGAQIHRDKAHLVKYKAKPGGRTFSKRRVEVTNQFGAQILNVRKPAILAVPSSKSTSSLPGDAPTMLDHFQCYADDDNDRSAFTPRTVVLKDQFKEETVRVLRPVALCNPVEKTHAGKISPIGSPDAHLVCYAIKAGRFTSNVNVRNQFGESTLRVRSPVSLCVPSEKRELQSDDDD
jgi:hypothetical protein